MKWWSLVQHGSGKLKVCQEIADVRPGGYRCTFSGSAFDGKSPARIKKKKALWLQSRGPPPHRAAATATFFCQNAQGCSHSGRNFVFPQKPQQNQYFCFQNASGCFWLLLDASGCFWFLLAAPGCSLLVLAASGTSWLLPAATGSSWLLLAAPG